MVAYWAAAVLNNGLGRYEDAAAAAGEVVTNAILPWLSMWALFELIEAAARVGDTSVLGTLWTNSRRLLGPLVPASRSASRRAVGRFLTMTMMPKRRIAKRSSSSIEPESVPSSPVRIWCSASGCAGTLSPKARERLRAAEEMFAEIGMEAFGGRARTELVAAGGKPRTRDPEVRDALTPQEGRSPGSPATGSPTRRSALSCSSAPVRSNTTCTRSSAS